MAKMSDFSNHNIFAYMLASCANLNFHMCCNIHHFGITKRRVMASKLQVTPTKLQVTLTKLQVTPTKLQVTRSKLTSLTAETNKFQLTNMLFITFKTLF